MNCYEYIQKILSKVGNTFDNIRSAILDGEEVDLLEFKDICQNYVFTDAESEDFERLSDSQRVLNCTRFTATLTISFSRVATISEIAIEIPESVAIHYRHRDFKCLTCEHYIDVVARNRCFEGLSCPKTHSAIVTIPEKYRSKVLIDVLYYILSAHPELEKYTEDFYNAIEAITDLTNIKRTYADDPEDIDAIVSQVAECFSKCRNCRSINCDNCQYNESERIIESEE